MVSWKLWHVDWEFKDHKFKTICTAVGDILWVLGKRSVAMSALGAVETSN